MNSLFLSRTRPALILVIGVLVLFTSPEPVQAQSPGLIQTLTSSLNISKPQAEGGTGSLLQLAKDNLSATDFSKLSDAIPDASSLMKKAPGISSSSGEESGLLHKALGSYDKISQQFESLGLSSDMISKFGSVVMDYLKGSGSGGAASALDSVLPSSLMGPAESIMKIF